MNMPYVRLADGSFAQVPSNEDGSPNWNAVSIPPTVNTDPLPRLISVSAFRQRFTIEEKTAIYTAAETSPELRAWLDDLAALEVVDLDNADLIFVVNWLAQVNIITANRVSELLA